MDAWSIWKDNYIPIPRRRGLVCFICDQCKTLINIKRIATGATDWKMPRCSKCNRIDSACTQKWITIEKKENKCFV